MDEVTLGEMNLDLRHVSEPHLENYPVVSSYLFSAAFFPTNRNIKPNAPSLGVPLGFRKEKGRGKVTKCTCG